MEKLKKIVKDPKISPAVEIRYILLRTISDFKKFSLLFIEFFEHTKFFQQQKNHTKQMRNKFQV